MRNGYKKWIKKIDPYVYDQRKIPTRALARVSVNNLNALRQVVFKGYTYQLWDAFTWRTTQQGHDYWRNKVDGRSDLSTEDYRYLEKLYDYWRGSDSNS